MISLAVYVTLISSLILYVSSLYLLNQGEQFQTSITTNTKNNRPGWFFNEHFDVSQEKDEVAICNICGESLQHGSF